jgi:UDP-N-acetylmuramate--alanine ligase
MRQGCAVSPDAGRDGARPPVPLDLTVPGRYHVVGVGGPGMRAIALVLVEMGHAVSGSDLRESPALDRLRAAGISVHVGHAPEHVQGVDAVTASTAIPAGNVELVAARDAGVPVLRRAGMLASICACARSVAVAGTHGKTTTTSMLAMILQEAGFAPSFVVGGDVNDVGAGAHWSGAPLLAVEADESDGTFLELPLWGTVLTNVETDHLDHFGSFQAIVDGFDRYLGQVEGPKVVCADDAVAAELAARHGATTYGTDPSATYQAVDVEVGKGTQSFSVQHAGDRMGRIHLPLRGLHNVRNATGALAMALACGATFEAAAAALARFGGVGRRFDFRGQHQGITLVDDYAHLPSEIAAVLAAARHGGDGWDRLVAVFQPNRYSRMARLSPDYRDAFVDADLTVITDIYPSGESPLPGVTGELVAEAVRAAHPELDVQYVPRRADLVEVLARLLRPGDVCVSMGCGDVASLPSEVLVRLAELDAGEPGPDASGTGG